MPRDMYLHPGTNVWYLHFLCLLLLFFCCCFFCALKASFGIVTMPVVLAERADEQSCTGNRLLSSLSGYLDKNKSQAMLHAVKLWSTFKTQVQAKTLQSWAYTQPTFYYCPI